MQFFTIVASAQTALPAAKAMMCDVANELRSMIAAGSLTVSSILFNPQQENSNFPEA